MCVLAGTLTLLFGGHTDARCVASMLLISVCASSSACSEPESVRQLAKQSIVGIALSSTDIALTVTELAGSEQNAYRGFMLGMNKPSRRDLPRTYSPG